MRYAVPFGQGRRTLQTLYSAIESPCSSAAPVDSGTTSVYTAKDADFGLGKQDILDNVGEFPLPQYC